MGVGPGMFDDAIGGCFLWVCYFFVTGGLAIGLLSGGYGSHNTDAIIAGWVFLAFFVMPFIIASVSGCYNKCCKKKRVYHSPVMV